MATATLPRSRSRREAGLLGHMTARIVAAWDAASVQDRQAGAEWYDNAYLAAAAIAAEVADAGAEIAATDIERVAGVFAAHSVQTSWSLNVRHARACLLAYSAGASVPPAHNVLAMRAQAWRIAGGAAPLDVLRGPKVRSFYLNIIGNPMAVTVDRHASAIAEGHDDPRPPQGRRYALIARAYQLAAVRRDTDPRTMQAACWISRRGTAA